MKTITILFLSVGITLLFYKFYWAPTFDFTPQKNETLTKKDTVNKTKINWGLYQKKQKKIIHKTPSETVLTKAGLPIEKSSNLKDRRKKIGDRYLSGPDSLKEVDSSKIKIINKENSRWKDLLSEQQLDGKPIHTKLFIDHQYSVVYSRNGISTLAERVNIIYMMPNGLKSSFSAIVNSENGKVMQTWNFSKGEKQKHNLEETKLAPSGILN